VRVVAIKMPVPAQFLAQLPGEAAFDRNFECARVGAGPVPRLLASNGRAALLLRYDHLYRAGVTEFFNRHLTGILTVPPQVTGLDRGRRRNEMKRRIDAKWHLMVLALKSPATEIRQCFLHLNARAECPSAPGLSKCVDVSASYLPQRAHHFRAAASVSTNTAQVREFHLASQYPLNEPAPVLRLPKMFEGERGELFWSKIVEDVVEMPDGVHDFAAGLTKKRSKPMLRVSSLTVKIATQSGAKHNARYERLRSNWACKRPHGPDQCSPADKHRHRTVGQNADRSAAEEQPAQTSPAVGRHDNQITRVRLGRTEDSVGWILIF
jgi:hypothetical protein